eukprot:scaffold844_cov268-Chaetoceros_neogracile.AAC.18
MASNGSPQLRNEDMGPSKQSTVPASDANPIPASDANPISTTASPPAITITASSTPASTTLMPRLKAQVEFYFCQQNLSRDMYLRNLLSHYGGVSVPLSVICNFPKVRNLCMTFNVQADSPLIMRALEGSTVAYVTPDALWISPIQPMPRLDSFAKMVPMTLGVASRSSSLSSMPEMNGQSSTPNSPVKAFNVNANSQQGQGYTNGNQQQQRIRRPTMSPRSRSHGTAQFAHAQSVPMGPGYVQQNYQYGNMPQLGKYAQPGFIYPPMQGHPHGGHGAGGSQMQYPQMYPGYTYVTTTLGPSPHKYFPPGRPVLNRASSEGPSDQMRRRNGPIPAGTGVGMARKLDGPKQMRKNKKKNGQNYDPGMQNTPGMINGTGGSNGGRSNVKIPLNRGQNEVQDSSGGAKTKRRNSTSKKSHVLNNDRVKDVSFDSKQFPALNPAKVTKEASEKPPLPIASISGYAAVLRAPSTKDGNNNGISNLIKESFDANEADISKSVNQMKLSTEGASTGTLLTEASCESLVNENHPSLKLDIEAPVVEAVKASRIVEMMKSQSPKEAKDEGALEANSKHDSGPAKDIAASPSPPLWGNKRSFIDAVRKQP